MHSYIYNIYFTENLVRTGQMYWCYQLGSPLQLPWPLKLVYWPRMPGLKSLTHWQRWCWHTHLGLHHTSLPSSAKGWLKSTPNWGTRLTMDMWAFKIQMFVHVQYIQFLFFRVLGNSNYALSSRTCLGRIVLRRQALLFHLCQKRWKRPATKLLSWWFLLIMMQSMRNISVFFNGPFSPRNGPWEACLLWWRRLQSIAGTGSTMRAHQFAWS